MIREKIKSCIRFVSKIECLRIYSRNLPTSRKSALLFEHILQNAVTIKFFAVNNHVIILENMNSFVHHYHILICGWTWSIICANEIWFPSRTFFITLHISFLKRQSLISIISGSSILFFQLKSHHIQNFLCKIWNWEKWS